MRITELIADTIQQLLEEQGGTIQIQRNDLASKLGCVPSQINYVITSRFTNAQGYVVESRRGGGGFIKIIKLNHSKQDMIIHIINAIGSQLDEASARAIITTLYEDDNLTINEAKLMLAVMADGNFKGMPEQERLVLRATLLKAMLINTIAI